MKTKFQAQLQKLYKGEEVGNFGTLKLDSEQFKLISKALVETRIKNLNLYGTQVSISAIKKLKELKLSHLQVLNLYCNSLFDSGVELLFSNIPNTLSILNICNNGITEDGAVFIASFLKTNPLLIALDISFNALRSTGAIAIFKALFNNTHLMRLNLHRNSIHSEIVPVLVELFERNHRLVSLKLEYNPLPGTTFKSILDFNSRNQELEKQESVILREQLVTTRKLALLTENLPLEILYMISTLEAKEKKIAQVFFDRKSIGKIDTNHLFSPMNLIRQVVLLSHQ